MLRGCDVEMLQCCEGAFIKGLPSLLVCSRAFYKSLFGSYKKVSLSILRDANDLLVANMFDLSK